MSSDQPQSELFDLMAVTRGRRRGERRMAVFWTRFTLAICPSISLTTIERTEMAQRRLMSESGRYESPEEDKDAPADLVGWLRHCEKGLKVLELPLASLTELEWRGGRKLLLRAAGRQWKIDCGSAWEAERELDLLRGEASFLVSPHEPPQSGIPKSLWVALAGLAMLLLPLLIDITLLYDHTPTGTLSESLRQIVAEFQQPGVMVWIYRAMMLVGVVVLFIGTTYLCQHTYSSSLVLADSSTPYTMTAGQSEDDFDKAQG